MGRVTLTSLGDNRNSQGLALAIQLIVSFLIFTDIYETLRNIVNFNKANILSAYISLFIQYVQANPLRLFLPILTYILLEKKQALAHLFLLWLIINAAQEAWIDYLHLSRYEFNINYIINLIPFYTIYLLLTALSLLHWGLLLKRWIGRRKHSREDPWGRS